MCKRIANRTREKEGKRERVTDSNAESRSGKQIRGCVSKPTDKLENIYGHHSQMKHCLSRQLGGRIDNCL